MLGGRVGITDNVTIGAGAMLAAGSGVMSQRPGRRRNGAARPAKPAREWLKANAALRRLARRGGEREPGS